MLSINKTILLFLFGSVSLIGTGFSSWLVVGDIPATAIGTVTTSDIIELNWLSSKNNINCGIGFNYSKNKGFKGFTKNYFDSTLIINQEQYKADVARSDAAHMNMNFSYSLTDQRFIIKSVRFYKEGNSSVYIEKVNPNTNSVFTFSMFVDETGNKDFNTFITSSKGATANIITEVYVDFVQGSSCTNLNTGLIYTITGGIVL